MLSFVLFRFFCFLNFEQPQKRQFYQPINTVNLYKCRTKFLSFLVFLFHTKSIKTNTHLNWTALVFSWKLISHSTFYAQTHTHAAVDWNTCFFILFQLIMCSFFVHGSSKPLKPLVAHSDDKTLDDFISGWKIRLEKIIISEMRATGAHSSIQSTQLVWTDRSQRSRTSPHNCLCIRGWIGMRTKTYTYTYIHTKNIHTSKQSQCLIREHIHTVLCVYNNLKKRLFGVRTESQTVTQVYKQYICIVGE